MFLISRVEIYGFWGKYKIFTDFHSDINIFIGKNGTGKTTFINMLYAVLKGDLKSLLLLEFQKITISLSDTNSKTRTIAVTKHESPESAIQTITYKLGNKSYKFSVSARDMDLIVRNSRRRSMMGNSLTELESKITELVNISSLTVHRITYDYPEEDYRIIRRSDISIIPPIDQRLDKLMQYLKDYQLTLAKQANEISSKLQKDVLVSMLYNQKFDKFSISDTPPELEKEKLSKAYQELGALDNATRENIDEHIKALNRSLAIIREFHNPQKSQNLNIQDIMPLSLLKRTQHIIDLSLEAEQKKKSVFELIDLFIDTIKNFIDDKDVSITPSGDLQTKKMQKTILLPALSSGEKQLLILLTETLLQKNAPFIFLADEPELSLHIEWQAKIVPSIKRLNTSAQVIVATHSPEIAAGNKAKVIDMEDILHV